MKAWTMAMGEDSTQQESIPDVINMRRKCVYNFQTCLIVVLCNFSPISALFINHFLPSSQINSPFVSLFMISLIFYIFKFFNELHKTFLCVLKKLNLICSPAGSVSYF